MKKVTLFSVIGFIAVPAILGAFLLFPAKNTNLENESLAGITLMQAADKPALEDALGKFTDEIADDKGNKRLFFDNSPYYATVVVNKDNQIVEISVGYPNSSGNTKFTTSRSIGSQSTFSDVQAAYGDQYYKKSYRNFMGSGDGRIITYKDKNRQIVLQFGFSQIDPDSDSKAEYLSHIRLFIQN